MNSRMQQRTTRSTDAPMDFTFTDRPSSNTPPAWADASTPKKRSHEAVSSSDPAFPSSPFAPRFGQNQNIPFIFATQREEPPPVQTWAPPSGFSATQAFSQPELHDVDMAEASPPKPEDTRPVAAGALRRVFKSRQKSRESRMARARDEDDGDVSSDEEGSASAMTQATSHHYTLNMPSPAPPQSDMPYILLGYLQFFFNLSLVLVFLYLVLQFILTVQRDVEQRISEYSMDIVQEISLCVGQYRNNGCDHPMPAMVTQCAHWKTCMDRDPTKMGRARVGAELIAEVVNSFVEPISWKTLAFTLTSLSFLTVFINTLLSLYRSRIQPQQAPGHPPPYVPPYMPHHFLPPAAAPEWSRPWHKADEEEDAPTRRRRIEGGAAVKVK
ncbi:Di-sulfide bridge nucleocytoplasmic transport domain-containing protein [Schizophyllum amplum]|uniref:Di-sulfide bridge nucleocytoplasmic transport domain-containing protein n=1 Tax=Schizophyllum amplum TaxID=97359 RepID=A0A550CE09_9AGAR|nr:Di-sulfide bridge nucleocytoplasmic transport domain-containing protein [Auriculariopsis ampla]